MSYVHEFGRLVHKYFRKERSVAFYADKLFISPKYLSLLVKEATGRSAANWIDEYVIMEAKNMLRFSGRNIQQVTYDLNFLTSHRSGSISSTLQACRRRSISVHDSRLPSVGFLFRRHVYAYAPRSGGCPAGKAIAVG